MKRFTTSCNFEFINAEFVLCILQGYQKTAKRHNEQKHDTLIYTYSLPDMYLKFSK